MGSFKKRLKTIKCLRHIFKPILERDKVIHEYAQAIWDRDTIIQEYLQAIQNKDKLIHEYIQTIADRNTEINKHTQTIENKNIAIEEQERNFANTTWVKDQTINSMISMIQKLFTSVYKQPTAFYGQFALPVDLSLFINYFLDSSKETNQGFFIECGAFDGVTECSCKFFEESLGWHGINIEPAKGIFDKLQQNRPVSRNLNVALSDKDGVAEFTHVILPETEQFCTNGSIEHTPEHRKWLTDIGCTFETYEVTTMTWRTLIEKEQIDNVDLFVLDVEGLEIAVIQGMKGCTVLPRVICIEYGHNNRQALYDELSSLGYVYDATIYANSLWLLK